MPSAIMTHLSVTHPTVSVGAQWQEDSRSPFVKKLKTILHPGEVNRIRELPQDSNIVATHSDAPEVFVWNLETQPGRQVKEKGKGPSLPSTPDLVLPLDATHAIIHSSHPPRGRLWLVTLPTPSSRWPSLRLRPWC